MGYYPITPSTEIAETLDAMKAEGEHAIRMIPGDGEHGAAGICFGATTAGGRVFNATPANGLLFAFEQLDPTPGLLNVRARWSISSTGEAAPEIASGRFDAEIPRQVNSAGATTDAIARAASQLADQIAAEARPALAAHDPGCR